MHGKRLDFKRSVRQLSPKPKLPRRLSPFDVYQLVHHLKPFIFTNIYTSHDPESFAHETLNGGVFNQILGSLTKIMWDYQ